jgi:hypothetical protein
MKEFYDGKVFDLHAYCIMSNHVHVVFEPASKSECHSDLLPLHKIMQSLKRHTARQANLILGREGAFWQDESYDRVIRDNGVTLPLALAEMGLIGEHEFVVQPRLAGLGPTLLAGLSNHTRLTQSRGAAESIKPVLIKYRNDLWRKTVCQKNCFCAMW